MFLGDFHVHSTFSDGKRSIPELVDLYGSLGFGALAITDHLCEQSTWLGQAARQLQHTLTQANFPLYIEILRSERVRAWREYGMVLISGFELTKNSVRNSRSAHIVALGVEEWIDADCDVVDLCAAIRAQGGLSIAAHPVSTRKIEKQTFHLWDRREQLRGSFDAWEVASGPHLFSEVLCENLPKIASSDLHHPRQIRSWKTQFTCTREQKSIFESIRRQEITFRFFDPLHLKPKERRDGLRHWLDPHGLDRITYSFNPRHLGRVTETPKTSTSS
jgi:hypothetical protein